MWWLLLGCNAQQSLGSFTLSVDDQGALTVQHAIHGDLIQGLTPIAGTGEAEVTFNVGSFRFEDLGTELTASAGHARLPKDGPIEVMDDQGELLGVLIASQLDDTVLQLDWVPVQGVNRAGFRADCLEDDPMLGFGSHAMDVDHHGQAFPLWTSEPGIGKSDSEDYPADWFLTGTRHATSFPMPWMLRPNAHHGLLVNTTDRIEVDLCKTRPERFEVLAWSETLSLLVYAGEPLDVVRDLHTSSGGYTLPEPWVFAPWNDAVRGSERVAQVAAALREAGAPSSVIWTEDWKGAEEITTGYHLKGEWTVDRELYPDVEDLAAELEDLGFKWFAYFSPFLEEKTQAWDETEALAIQSEEGGRYVFTGATFLDSSMLDLTNTDAREWARERMEACLDLGFDGWMADYAEWLPTDAVLAQGDAWEAHNAWPLYWQELNREVFDDEDGAYFVRSGWTTTIARAPVVWLGDQRTSFDADDGYPTILPLALGLSAGGHPVTAHDVAGYQSVGNPPSTKELWFRWAALGAWSPILRTHHGAQDSANWQFDSDAETTAHWAEMARVHMSTWPYRYGLAAQAARDGTPVILMPAMLFEGEDWGRMAVWMLGPSVLVAPVLEEGATERQVDLPQGRWIDFWTGEPVSSGVFQADPSEIPVFVAEGAVVPMFDLIPDTMVPVTDPDLVGPDQADASREVLIFGAGGSFVEADGTTYTVQGTPSSAETVTETLSDGEVSVGGATVLIEGDVERAYTLRVIP